MRLDKTIISRNFSRFASNYESSARLQKRVAEELISQAGKVEGLVLDLGSGPGVIGKLSGWNIIPLDISFEMCRLAGNGVNADIENLPFRNESFDHIISSLSFQWVDLEKAAMEVFRVLKAGGSFSFSTFSPNSLKDIVAAFSYLDSGQHVMNFEHAIRIFAILKKTGFSDVVMNSQKISYIYPNMIAALKSIKEIGASYDFGGGGIKSRSYFNSLENAYRSISKTEAGVVLEWEIFYITAKK